VGKPCKNPRATTKGEKRFCKKKHDRGKKKNLDRPVCHLTLAKTRKKGARSTDGQCAQAEIRPWTKKSKECSDIKRAETHHHDWQMTKREKGKEAANRVEKIGRAPRHPKKL